MIVVLIVAETIFWPLRFPLAMLLAGAMLVALALGPVGLTWGGKLRQLVVRAGLDSYFSFELRRRRHRLGYARIRAAAGTRRDLSHCLRETDRDERVMPTEPKQPIPRPPPDVVPNPARPPTPQETPKPDLPIGVPQPGPDVVPAPEPEEIPATLPPELPPEAPGVAGRGMNGGPKRDQGLQS